MEIFTSCSELGRAAVTFSALEAGGFHPVFFNLQICCNNAINLEAYGGVIIALPLSEFTEAREWLTFLQTQAIEDQDTKIKRQRFGKWKNRIVIFLIFFPFLLLLPAIFIHPRFFLLLIVALDIITIIIGAWSPLNFTMYFFVAILLHAQYIAIPKYLPDS